MPFQQSQSPSLPSIRQLGLAPYSDRDTSCHEHRPQSQGFAPRGALPSRQIRGDLMFRYISSYLPPFSWSDERSDDDCMSHRDHTIFTPHVSTTANRTTPHERRDSRISIGNTCRVTKRKHRRLPSPVTGDSEQKSKEKKTAKEKLNRSNQGAMIYQAEDLMELYIGLCRNEQSGGNGNAAGLNGNKINVLRALLALFNHLMHNAWCEAADRGNLGLFRAKMQALAGEAIENGLPAYQGTFCQSSDPPCEPLDTKSKGCVVHGTPDWRTCRKERCAANFARNCHR